MYDYILVKPELSEDTLIHYGIPGMKWGQRKQRVTLGLGRGRRFRTGTAVPSGRPSQQQVSTKPKKVKKKRKGYSDKDYRKYKDQGLSHKEAVDRAKKDRKKKIRNIAIGAAAVGLTALAVYKKSTTPRKGETQIQMFERKKKERAAKEDRKRSNYKFKNEKEYERAKNILVSEKKQKAAYDNRKYTELYKDMTGKSVMGYVPGDPGRVKITAAEVRQRGYDLSKSMKKQKRAAAKRIIGSYLGR